MAFDPTKIPAFEAAVEKTLADLKAELAALKTIIAGPFQAILDGALIAQVGKIEGLVTDFETDYTDAKAVV